jgi:hypothetical protein
VAGDPGSLQLCGIADYSAQKLPGERVTSAVPQAAVVNTVVHHSFLCLTTHALIPRCICFSGA